MGIRFIRDGRVVDNGGIDEVDTNSANPATIADGRSYLDSTNATYYQDGSVVKTSDRVSIRAGFQEELPQSGNISKTYPGNKLTD